MSADLETKNVTIVGDMDPTVVVKELRKIGNAEMIFFGSVDQFVMTGHELLEGFLEAVLNTVKMNLKLVLLFLDYSVLIKALNSDIYAVLSCLLLIG